MVEDSREADDPGDEEDTFVVRTVDFVATV
jgi:hypothetical protein